MQETNKIIRESQFELVRIIAQYIIVLYHLIHIFTVGIQDQHPILVAVQIPLHIGVILFVLLSGYFGMKPSVYGGGKLLVMMVVYYLPLALITDYPDVKFLIRDCLFVSHTPYWFMRTYLILYLFSPVLNNYLDKSSNKEVLRLIVVLFFSSTYIALVQGDDNLIDGKNLTNFMLLYVIGHYIRVKKDDINEINKFYVIFIWLIINVALVLAYVFLNNELWRTMIMNLSFTYASPFLIMNGILFFIIFFNIKIKSQKINYIATSVFAVYLLHCQPFILNSVIGPVVHKLIDYSGANIILLISLLAVLSAIIFIICVVVDKLFTPLWRIVNTTLKRIESKIINEYGI